MVRLRCLALGMMALIGTASLSVAQDRDNPDRPTGPGVGTYFGRVIRVETDQGILTLSTDRDVARTLSVDTPTRTTPRDKAAAGAVMTFRFGKDVRVTIDGREATASNLREGLYARVFPSGAVVTREVNRARPTVTVERPRERVLILPVDTRVVRTGRDRVSDSVETRPTDPPRPRAEPPTRGPGRDRPSDSVETRPTDPPRPRIEDPRYRVIATVRPGTATANLPTLVAERIEAFTRAPAEPAPPPQPDRSLRTRPGDKGP